MLGVSTPAFAERYSPLFSPKMLAGLDAPTRERLEALETENYQRWRNRNPQAPDVAATQRQHKETEAVLRRIQESRAIARENKRRNAPGAGLSERQKRDCATVASEIEELGSGGAFYENTADGGKRYLSDEEIANRVQSQKKSYKRHCEG